MNTDALGLCLGASTLGLARLSGGQVAWTRSYLHEGNPREVLVKALAEIPDLSKLRIAATGRKFRSHLAISNIAEPEAVELALIKTFPKGHPYRIIVSAGAETFMAYYVGADSRIETIHTGNKCASGTGEFFLQQLGRMDVTLGDVAKMDMPETFHKVSGRCSVFCKSDCTHALNKGIPRSQVVGGLARMMAGKIVELVRKLPKSPVMLIGGCANNRHMVEYLKEEIPDLHVPETAPCFEALGAAWWAYENETASVEGDHSIFASHGSTFSFLKPLSESRHLVEFKARPSQPAQPGDVTLMGLDVGSTTTKGVIVRRSDKAILAADYLRTNGDPVGAARRVYASLAKQMNVPITIEALGVTGSGRQIAGLHAMTDGVINEIVAHATAAVYFDPEVDTIFEIGGQDAKYTYITNGVPSDYAMNEACSAGTGSFLEESAKESLGLDVTSIGKTALNADTPLNFNDQCAAFIGSDIKGAIQEGVSTENIIAGLVYSVCMNYINRVKGNRPVGKKVFMQGGVCYNEAVPVAIASLTGKSVVVPPEPGLMGAFGVALEVERRMEQGWIEAGSYDLTALADREVTYLEPFRCKGGIDKCDLRCEIARIEIDGKIYPFGGICNRYDNLVHRHKVETGDLNFVIKRERRLYRDLEPEQPGDTRPTMGLSRSFLTNSFFPFYRRFFAELGFRVVLPDGVDPAGFDLQGAAFCFPGELAHGYMARLLAMNPDYVFLPHVRAYPSGAGQGEESCTCVFVQGEPYYLRTAFAGVDPTRVLSPRLDFTKDLAHNRKALEEVARQIGANPGTVGAALEAAMKEQREFQADILEMGRQAFAALEADPDRIAVILFGRTYNSLAMDANKGIPAKFASRNITIIPFDMVPSMEEAIESDHHMYWAAGRLILKAAHFVKKNPRLFGTYITNFSCGPDSFLVSYFRDIMGRKPSLTLELDNHTADAGLETRIEAFLDIVQYYRQLNAPEATAAASNFRPAAMEVCNGKFGVRTSSGEWLPLSDPRVIVALPAMGRFGTPMLQRVFESQGIRACVLPPADEEVLKIGRGHSSCKECLPLQTTIGSILHYLKSRPKGEVTAYFMASTDGPCRFGQYHVLSKRVFDSLQIPDVAVLSLTTANGYAGLGDKFALAAWRAIVLGDVFLDMWSAILAGAEDREAALKIFHEEHRNVLDVMGKPWRVILRQLKKTARHLSTIRLKRPFNEIPKIALVGEIYVRQDPISLQNLIEHLGDRGFIVRVSQTSEWIKYLDWLVKRRIEGAPNLGFWIRYIIKNHLDRKIRQALAPSGLFNYEPAGVAPVMEAGGRHVSPYLTGEAILTVGSALHEILHPACGVIAIGPFGCMPTRVAESILNVKLNTEEKRALSAGNGHGTHASILKGNRRFPFLAIETDGRPFPQVIEARMETFCLQAQRLNEEMIR